MPVAQTKSKQGIQNPPTPQMKKLEPKKYNLKERNLKQCNLKECDLKEWGVDKNLDTPPNAT